MSARLWSYVLIGVCLFVSVDARAQGGQEKVDAQGLFDLGKGLMVEGKFSEACPKLEDSLRLDPVLGTRLFLAECYENVGRTASAWAEFREAQSLAVKQSDPREKVARDRANALEPHLSKLVILVPSAPAPGLKVTRDGFDVGEPLWGAAIAVDPGQHTIMVSAPKKKDWTTNVAISAAASISVTVPLLADAPGNAPVVASRAVPAPTIAPPAATLVPQRDSHRGRAQRIVGIGVAAVGVVGLGIGTIFGLEAKSNLDGSNDGHCMKVTNFCDASGLDMRSTAVTDGTISTLSFGLGLAALAGGAVLYFTAPKEDTAAIAILPSAGPRGGSLTLRASF